MSLFGQLGVAGAQPGAFELGAVEFELGPVPTTRICGPTFSVFVGYTSTVTVVPHATTITFVPHTSTVTCVSHTSTVTCVARTTTVTFIPYSSAVAVKPCAP